MATYDINNTLVDPNEFKRKNPNVKIINKIYYDYIEVGHYIKIRNNQENFWVSVTEFDGDNITAEVYYELGMNKFKPGDLLKFKKKFSFDIYDPQVFNLIPNIHLANS